MFISSILRQISYLFYRRRLPLDPPLHCMLYVYIGPLAQVIPQCQMRDNTHQELICRLSDHCAYLKLGQSRFLSFKIGTVPIFEFHPVIN